MSQTVLPRSSFHSREDNLVLNPPEFMAQLINLIFETLKKLGIFFSFFELGLGKMLHSETYCNFVHQISVIISM